MALILLVGVLDVTALELENTPHVLPLFEEIEVVSTVGTAVVVMGTTELVIRGTKVEDGTEVEDGTGVEDVGIGTHDPALPPPHPCL